MLSNHMVRLFALSLVLVGAGCAVSPRPRADVFPAAQGTGAERTALEKALDAIFDRPQFAAAFVGVRVETLDGRVIYDREGHRNFVPASTLKLFTTAGALALLGPDHTWTTRVETNGVIADGVLLGDVIIVGGGDPTLGAWHPDNGNNAARVFEHWIRALRQAGIRRIEGDIIGDGRYFTTEYIHGDWVYSDLPYWYAAGSSGLAIEENGFRTLIRPASRIGDPAIITTNPTTSYIRTRNETTTGPGGGPNNADIVWRNEDNLFVYGRRIAIDSSGINERGSIWDGARYTAHLFREALERDGIPVAGTPFNVRDALLAHRLAVLDATPRRVLATTTSPPLSEAVKVVNQVSHNFFADMILRTVGIEKAGEGSFANGAGVIEEWLISNGLPDGESLAMRDGSGLASTNMFQPRQATWLLRHQHNSTPAGVAFRDSLSVAGENGWLARRYEASPLKGRLRAKTGYIGLVRTLAGYLSTSTNEELVFCMMTNHHTTRSAPVDAMYDEALKVLAEWGAEF